MSVLLKVGSPHKVIAADTKVLYRGVSGPLSHAHVIRHPVDSLLVWFLASFDIGPDIAHGYTIPRGGAIPPTPQTAPTASWIATPDGSCR